MEKQVFAFIEKNWDFCIKQTVDDRDSIIGVPYPYTVPSVGHFELIYYWDTYFTNLGLLLSNRAEQARNNTDDILFLVRKYGFMPNGNHKLALDRSQPPFLSLMVRDVYDNFRDREWLSVAYQTLEIEYQFWMTERNTEIGLNRYGNSGFTQSYEHYADIYRKRIGYTPEGTAEELAKQFLATAECGWDISPRFGDRVFDFVPVDLNALLYLFEKNMAYFATELNLGTEEAWKEKAKIRKERMEQYLISENGVFMDYDYVHDKHSGVFSVASFFPMFAGMAEDVQVDALVASLNRIEATYGVSACEEVLQDGVYQWGFPNGWPCLQYIMWSALNQYGFCADAKRIAKKYSDLIEAVFKKTGNLWEKYNVVDGNIDVVNEYDMPAMIGWTAGVYLAAKEFLKN